MGVAEYPVLENDRSRPVALTWLFLILQMLK
jgi:hypothetical protein